MNFLKKVLKNKIDNNDNIEIDKSKLPVHIAIIMDGNGRWAKKRNLPKNLGHREGGNTLKKIVSYCGETGIKYLTVYAFSTENWNRPKSEVDALMALLMEYLRNAERELSGKNVRIRIVGNIRGLSEEVQKEIARVEKATEKNDGICLNIAWNYGGRDEIVHVVKEIVKELDRGNIKAKDIDEKIISKSLYTVGIPDPDLLIRTSGEKRLSNFLLWQCAYTEFWYTDVLWPDIREEHIKEAILDYQKRNRRFGGV
jgi:undecaprenyl diphosphate synthase